MYDPHLSLDRVGPRGRALGWGDTRHQAGAYIIDASDLPGANANGMGSGERVRSAGHAKASLRLMRPVALSLPGVQVMAPGPCTCPTRAGSPSALAAWTWCQRVSEEQVRRTSMYRQIQLCTSPFSIFPNEISKIHVCLIETILQRFSNRNNIARF